MLLAPALGAAHLTVSILVLVLPIMAVGLLIEGIYRPTPPRSLRLNVVLGVLFYLVDSILAVSVNGVALAAVSRLPGAGVLALPMGADPSWLRIAGAMAVLLIAGDFFYYWFHRTQHAIPWLWRFHAVHHSDEDMHVTTARRSHGLELPLLTLGVSVPSFYLFGPTPGIGLPFVLVSHAWAYYSHLNVPWSLGRWNWLCVTPKSHRLHHSSDRAHFDKNFAMFTPVWDCLFGTYLQPPEGPIATGVDGMSLTRVRDAYRL